MIDALGHGLEFVLVIAVLSLHLAIGVCRLLGYDNAPVIWRTWQLRNYVLHLEKEVAASETLVADNDHSHEQQLTYIAEEVAGDLERIWERVNAGDTRDALHELERLWDRVLDHPGAPSAFRLYDGPRQFTPRVIAYHSDVKLPEAA